MTRPALSLVSTAAATAEPTSITPELATAARGRRLEQARFAADDHLIKTIETHTGRRLARGIAPTERASVCALSLACDDASAAHWREVEYWKGRTARLERRVRDLLDDGRGTPQQRAEALTTLDGARALNRDAGLLTRSEAEVIGLYRALGKRGQGQQAIRYLLRELTATPTAGSTRWPLGMPSPMQSPMPSPL